MKIEFDIEIEDMMAFQKYHLDHSKQFKRTKLLVAAMMPFTASILITLSIINDKLDPIKVILLAVLSFGWVMLYPKRLTKRALAKSKKIISEGDSSAFLGPHTMSFNEEGILDKSTDSEHKTNWSGIKKLRETETHYFLYNSPISAFLIPKIKVFEHTEELDEIFEKYLNKESE